MRGTLFQIQRWCVHDGEGVRTTVFLKGCPLRCAWCANPESWSPREEKGHGFSLSVAELLSELRKDEAFYRGSSGGVTFSGGEPFAQAGFLRACLKECAKRGYDTAVETSGCFPWKGMEELFVMLDGIFFDIKQMSPIRHRELTGRDNALILENARRVLSLHSNVTVRVPLVRGCNDDIGNIEEMCAFLAGFPKLRGVEFLPYHNLGFSKYASLDLPAPPDFSAPEPEVMEKLEKIVSRFGIPLIRA